MPSQHRQTYGILTHTKMQGLYFFLLKLRFPTCLICKPASPTRLRALGYHDGNSANTTQSFVGFLTACMLQTLAPTHLRCDFFCSPVWTASTPQMQSDQVSRVLGQKEALPSTILSSLLTTRVLKPLGQRWCTSIGSGGGPRCPKVMCSLGRIFF